MRTLNVDEIDPSGSFVFASVNQSVGAILPLPRTSAYLYVALVFASTNKRKQSCRNFDETYPEIL